MTLRLTTDHQLLPDASDFADILGPRLAAAATYAERTFSFRAVRLPALRIPSGRITASDGYMLGGEPFAQTVPPGEYPLLLAMAVINPDERIAFAKLRFRPEPAVRWQIATLPGQDPATLKPNELFGYGVDSGTGCLSDSEAYKHVCDAGDDFPDTMMEASQQVYSDTRDWVTVETPTGSFAVFSSGFGDGFYASYFGYSESGALVSLVTDFGIAKWPGALTGA